MSKRKRIDKLTREQEAAMAGYAQQWVARGLSTAPAERAVVEQGIRDCYRLAKLAPPKTIVWVSSPVVGALAAPAAAFTLELLRRLGSESNKKIGDTVRATVDAAVDDTVRDTVGDTVGDPNELRQAIGQAIGKVWSQRWHWRFGGRLWPAWDAWRSFFVDVCDLDLAEAKEHYAAWMAAQSAGWWWPFKDFAMVCDTPEIIARDANGRLHAETGPAVRFRDGWSIYCWHGTRIPAEWIENKASLDPVTALNWPNAEQRRSAAEIIGWAKVLEQLKPVVVHKDPNPQIGTLLRADLPGSPGEQFLQVRCGTGRDFVLPVPPTVQTAMQAQEWCWGLNPGEYQLEART